MTGQGNQEMSLGNLVASEKNESVRVEKYQKDKDGTFKGEPIKKCGAILTLT